jgi:hypothetical protein
MSGGGQVIIENDNQAEGRRGRGIPRPPLDFLSFFFLAPLSPCRSIKYDKKERSLFLTRPLK